MTERTHRIIIVGEQHSSEGGLRGGGDLIVCATKLWKKLDGERSKLIWRVPEISSGPYAERARCLLTYTILPAKRLEDKAVHIEIRKKKGPLVDAVRRAVQDAGWSAGHDLEAEWITFDARPPAESDWIAESKSMRELDDTIRRLAPKKTPILIVGPTGSGKETVAQRLHQHSGREGNFTALNGALLSPELAESRLFGHEEGAFTGADTAQNGRVMEAAGGSFFLDEVFHVPAGVQPALLRAFNDADQGIARIRRLGGRELETIEVRLITACQSHPLELDDSPVRDDLYYRIAGEIITIPPLTERPEDIEALLNKVLDGVELSEEARALYREHDWPGNIRELKAALMRLRASRSGSTISADEARLSLQLPTGFKPSVRTEALDVALAREEFRIRRAARLVSQTTTAAAKRLGVSDAHWARDMKKLSKKNRRGNMRRIQVAVIGSASGPDELMRTAEALGAALVDAGYRIVCGGLGGVMLACARGARHAEGYDGSAVIGFLPSLDATSANEFVDIVVPTGMQYARNVLVVSTADLVIAVGGGSGTLSEIALAWQLNKPIIAVSYAGGWSKRLAGTSLDRRREDTILEAESVPEAVSMVAKLLRLSEPSAEIRPSKQ